jgi:hypothetical protein
VNICRLIFSIKIKEKVMRFEKRSDFVEITRAIFYKNGKCVRFIDTNLDFEYLPVEFQAQVPETDK